MTIQNTLLKNQEKELTTKEILFQYVLNNKFLWYIAFANVFVYFVRYGVVDWAPTYLTEAKGFSPEDSRWSYFLYEYLRHTWNDLVRMDQ